MFRIRETSEAGQKWPNGMQWHDILVDHGCSSNGNADGCWPSCKQLMVKPFTENRLSLVRWNHPVMATAGGPNGGATLLVGLRPKAQSRALVLFMTAALELHFV